MDPTFYPALFSYLDHVTLAGMGVGVLVWLVKKYPYAIGDLLLRIRKIGPGGAEMDPAITQVRVAEERLRVAGGQLDSLKLQLLADAPPAQIASHVVQLQGSLGAVSSLVGHLSTEASDTASVQGKVGD